MTHWIYILYMCMLTSACAQDRVSGSVCGTALDERGQVASSVLVAALTLGNAGPIRGARADEHGRYCIVDLVPGKYLVSAADEERGYPPLWDNFFYDSQSLPIRVFAQSVARYDFKIPYQAGFLRINLKDARTGKQIPLMSVAVSVRGAEGTRYRREGCSSTKVLLVPPNQEINLGIHAKRYKRWPADADAGNPINLREGESKTLLIALEPDP